MPLYHVKFIWFYRTKIYKWDFWQKLPLKKDIFTITQEHDSDKEKLELLLDYDDVPQSRGIYREKATQ